MAPNFAGGMEAAELEFNGAGAVGEGASISQLLGGLRGIVGYDDQGEAGVTAAGLVAPVAPNRDLTDGSRLTERPGPVPGKELRLSFANAAHGVPRLAFPFADAEDILDCSR